jgi:hypothetical protein
LTQIASGIGVDLFEGAPRYPSDTAGWLAGGLDMIKVWPLPVETPWFEDPPGLMFAGAV